ncbi:MAG: hypothetical protein J6O50_11410 [Ruminiclostridium sp.]|nr:hypothetical protein [Ruminiclostridium sp.]
MLDNDLVKSFEESVLADSLDLASDLAEVGLDSILDDGVIKDIPIISATIGVFKIGSSIKERHYIKKLVRFIDSCNKGIVDKDMKERIKTKFLDEKKSKKELEHILLIIDRFIEEEKADMLAKIYIAYLDSKIDWSQFVAYSVVLDRFLPGDYSYYSSSFNFNVQNNSEIDILLRLSGLGLLIEETRKEARPLINDQLVQKHFENNKDKRVYVKTDFGRILTSILGGFY